MKVGLTAQWGTQGREGGALELCRQLRTSPSEVGGGLIDLYSNAELPEMPCNKSLCCHFAENTYVNLKKQIMLRIDIVALPTPT